MTAIYLVTDGETCGNPDLYGIFSTRELAEAWIVRQRDVLKYMFWDGLAIEEYPLNEAEDLKPL